MNEILHKLKRLDIKSRMVKGVCGVITYCSGYDKHTRIPPGYTKKSKDVTCQKCLKKETR